MVSETKNQVRCALHLVFCLLYWGTRIRTSIHSSKGWCAAIAPCPNDEIILAQDETGAKKISVSRLAILCCIHEDKDVLIGIAAFQLLVVGIADHTAQFRLELFKEPALAFARYEARIVSFAIHRDFCDVDV